MPSDSFKCDLSRCLTHHARCGQIMRSGHGFKVNGQSMRGCVTRLQQTFYPEFDVRYVLTSNSKKRKRNESGKDRGKRVDEEVGQLVHGITLLHAPHTFTIKWLRALRHWKWKPIAAQLNIFDEHLSIATAVDCICMDEKGCVIIIEVKTGYEDYVHKSTHFMRAPLGDIKNTPQNQHFLQLGLMCIILEKHYWKHPYKAYVVRIDERGIRREELPKWAHGQKIYQTLHTAAVGKKKHDELGAGDEKKI